MSEIKSLVVVVNFLCSCLRGQSEFLIFDPMAQYYLGKEKQVKWKAIKVGDIVKVRDDGLFPADIICLKTGLQNNVCFIRTTNLDGESNLKIRKPVDLRTVPGLDENPDREEDQVEPNSLLCAQVASIGVGCFDSCLS